MTDRKSACERRSIRRHRPQFYGKMHIYGLTGGIASGKSTVSATLAELKCPIIDADVIAREGTVHVESTWCSLADHPLRYC